MFYLDTEITETEKEEQRILKGSHCVPCPSCRVGSTRPELHSADICPCEHFSPGTTAETEG